MSSEPQSSRSFQKVALVEYPRKGVWRVGFVATSAKGEVGTRLAADDVMAIFVPNTPNVTAGFLVYVPRRDVIILDMSVEEGAKMIISGGLVAPRYPRLVEPPSAPPKEISEAAE